VKLNGEEARRLHCALLSAFPSYELLEIMLRFHLDAELPTIVSNSNLDVVTYRVITWAESQGKTVALIRGARSRNPDNPDLKEVAPILLMALEKRYREKGLTVNW